MLCDGIVFSHEKKEILPFSTWTDHESIVLNKSETNAYAVTYLWKVKRLN